MKAPCSVCQRIIGVTATNRIYAHVHNGSQCPGAGQPPHEAIPLTQVLAEGYEPSLAPSVTQEVAPGSQMPTRAAVGAVGGPGVFQLGDRVIRKPDGPGGVVQALNNDGEVFVHWGTTMIRDPQGNQIENRFEDWVPESELKLQTEPIFHGTEAENNRETLWNPAERS